MSAGTAEAWLTTFTEALRQQLPQGQYILSHARAYPWTVIFAIVYSPRSAKFQLLHPGSLHPCTPLVHT